VGLLKLLRTVCTVGVAVVYLASIGLAQESCPFMRCRGPDGDVWALPLVLSLVGIPATFFSLMFAADWLWPKSRAVVVLRYLAIAAVVLPIVGAAVFGLVAGMRGGRAH
jgi:hypothetical protein